MGYSILNIAIGTLLFSAIVIGATVFIGDVSNEYNQTVNYPNSTVLDVSEEMRERAEDISASLNNTQTQGWVDRSYYFLSAGINSLFMMLGLTDLMLNLITGISGLIVGIPAWFVGIMVAIVSLIIVFAIISGILGRSSI